MCNEATRISNATRFITLGDGDLTFSLDLGRWVVSNEEARLLGRVEIRATGIDSMSEFRAKYRDADSICSKLEALNKDETRNISVKLICGVNAIVSPEDPNDLNDNDHVIFNHPHLGTENALLHHRFLCHFFDSSKRHWMRKSGGVLHVTLVRGQCERWQCLEAAKAHDLVLLNRYPFRPPPLTQPAYHHRRHQSGRSFASRATGSETLTFGRRQDHGCYVATCLPWQHQTPPSNNHPFSCPHCPKSFKEERSLKNHIQNVHQNISSSYSHTCDTCSRTFTTERALADHKLAKHNGLHTDIKPDWYHPPQPQNHDPSDSDAHTSLCPVCGEHTTSQQSHLAQFIPERYSVDVLHSEAEADATHVHVDNLVMVLPFECSFCSKRFREQRALLQHQNVCSLNNRKRVDETIKE